MAETNGLLNRRTLIGVPRVRIPPSPQVTIKGSRNASFFYEPTGFRISPLPFMISFPTRMFINMKNVILLSEVLLYNLIKQVCVYPIKKNHK